MRRIVLVLVIAFAVIAIALSTPAAAQTTPAADDVRHSGRIIEVAADGSAIVLEEVVAWNGPGTGVITRSIRLTPRTSLRLIERKNRPELDRTANPGWEATPIEVSSLRRGDFATVTTHEDQRSVAVALHVIRPVGS